MSISIYLTTALFILVLFICLSPEINKSSVSIYPNYCHFFHIEKHQNLPYLAVTNEDRSKDDRNRKQIMQICLLKQNKIGKNISVHSYTYCGKIYIKG